MDLSGDAGDRAAARRTLDAAIAIDPKNMIVREKYMIYLQTRWGGSVEEMRSFLHECQAAGLADVHLKDLEAMVVEDEAWVHRYRDGDVDAAVRDYRRAAKLNPKTSCEPCGALNQAGDALVDAKNYAEAIKLYSQVLRQDPNSIHALSGRGFCELQQSQPEAAVADLERAAGMNDAYAQDTLGRMYLVGTSVPQDRDKAIAWLEKAAAQNYEPAKKLLPMALNKYAQPRIDPGGPRF
jgi:TPR repeat protein